MGKVRQARFNVSASETHHASVGLKPRSFLCFGGAGGGLGKKEALCIEM